MSDIIAVSDDSLTTLLASSPAVLLDLWAPWCQPCRALAPHLETLARQASTGFTIAKLNVDLYPDIQQRFAVRGIPTLLLFKDGQEVSRQVGVKSLTQLRIWLEAEGITLNEQAAAAPAPSRTPWPAFYNDASLHAFLSTRLKNHALANEIKPGFMPYWTDNQGTLSAVIAHHEQPEVFERITGLPVALAFVLEQVPFSTPDEVEALFNVLTPGKDVSQVPLRWTLDLLSDRYFAWSDWLQDADLDALRKQWCERVSRHLAGETLPSTVWTPLVKATTDEQKFAQPAFELENNLIAALGALSPLPDASEISAWGSAKIQLGFALAQIIEIRAGWSREDRAAPGLRERWFRARQAQEPEQTFTDQRLKEMRDLWLSENRDFAAREDALYADYGAHVQRLHAPLQENLLRLLREAPEFVV